MRGVASEQGYEIHIHNIDNWKNFVKKIRKPKTPFLEGYLDLVYEDLLIIAGDLSLKNYENSGGVFSPSEIIGKLILLRKGKNKIKCMNEDEYNERLTVFKDSNKVLKTSYVSERAEMLDFAIEIGLEGIEHKNEVVDDLGNERAELDESIKPEDKFDILNKWLIRNKISAEIPLVDLINGCKLNFFEVYGPSSALSSPVCFYSDKSDLERFLTYKEQEKMREGQTGTIIEHIDIKHVDMNEQFENLSRKISAKKLEELALEGTDARSFSIKILCKQAGVGQN